MGKIVDVSGEKFGKLTAIKFVKTQNRRSFFLCLCDCGNEVIVKGNALKSGNTKSCGCLQKEVASTHCLSKSTEYSTWADMLNRCRNAKHKSYKNYGGRGITVCDEWLVFENFYRDMGPKPKGMSIDRINNNGNYEPSNCKWATTKEQLNNQRRNRLIEYNGEKHNIGFWSEKTGINKNTLTGRIKTRGWAPERALTTIPKTRIRGVVL